ncbi:MAG: AmmeMemoRadiSam system protein A [Chloroflexi bacterium]|nr:AmmeMemoRadiSam system protein A [Chloroflexota bacterium]
MTETKLTGTVFGCIAPHPPLLVPGVGRGQESAVSSTSRAMHLLAEDLAKSAPDVIALVSPHGSGFSDAMGVFVGESASGDMTAWGDLTPGAVFENDRPLAAAILDECALTHVPARPIGNDRYVLDHGAMVPLHFLAPRAGGLPLVPLTFSFLALDAHFAFGKAIARASEILDRRLALIASGDLSHRLIAGAPAGYDPMGKEFDRQLIEALRTMDTKAVLNLDPDLVERAGECGLRSVAVLLGALDGLAVKPRILSYEGPFGVGYLVAAFDIARSVHPLVELARMAVESRVLGTKAPRPEQPLSPEMQERAGVFICLKKGGELRGCIGTFEPTKSTIAEEVIANAVSSATRDPRFPPVAPPELPDLEYTVDVLTRPEPAGGPDELDPRRYGVIVESGWRRGLLLPDLEGVDTVAEQIAIARQKAGISPREPVKLYRFEVRRYK